MSWDRWDGDKLKRLTEKQMSQALKEAAEATLGEALKLVPHDIGTLQETGMTKVNPNDPLDVVISFGGGFGTPFTKVPYAVKWHEVPANFQKGRQHNYLKQPIDNFAPNAVRKQMIKKAKRLW